MSFSMDAGSLNERVGLLVEEARLLVSTISDKGPKYFQRPLISISVLLIVSYFFIYSPSVTKSDETGTRVAAEKAKVQHAAGYKSLCAGEKAMLEKMVPINKKDGWLFNKLLELAQKEDITLESVGAQEEKKKGDVISIGVSAKVKLNFRRLGFLVSRIESAPIRMKVVRITVSKIKYQDPGDLEKYLGNSEITLDIRCFSASAG